MSAIIVTPGETALIAAFKQANVTIGIKNLLIGDLHIVKTNSDGIETVQYIFERKSKGDLDASIKDGRYREQKSRLLESGIDRSNIIYIIEQMKKPADPAAKKRVWSAICNTIHRDGFRVMQTGSVEETVLFVSGIGRSVDEFTSIVDSNPSKDVNVDIKKRQVTPNEWFKYSLTLIPRCSMEIATVITEKCPTITDVINLIQNEGMDCFSELRHGESKRRVGKKLSNEICQILFDSA